MRNFSITPNSSQSTIEQYSDFLARDVYSNMQPCDVNDPLFLQQLGVLQAESIKKAINTNSRVTYSGFQETNATIADSANFIGNKISSVANMLTSSLDEGFGTLNNSLATIDSGIGTINTNLSNVSADIQNVNQNLGALGNVVGRGFSVLNAGINATNAQLLNVNKNLNALGNMIGQGISNLYTQMRMSNDLLDSILTELKIPETQRERRYHVEEGAKYLSNALTKGHKLYFEDAFDEFNKAISIERKDFFSWFNLGIIYLRSKEHIDISKAIEAFERFIHYAQAEVMHKQNQHLEYQIDDAHLYLAESYYLQQKFKEAISETEQCVHAKFKADFMKVKYLSATNDNANKQEAANILSQLIEKNRYIVLQILEDDDIVRNEFIISLLKKLRQDTVEKAKSLLSKIVQSLKNDCQVKQTMDKISEIENLLQKQTFLESYEAIGLMEKKHKWEKDKILFYSNLVDFASEELHTRGRRLYDFKRYEDAIICLNQLIEINPDDTKARSLKDSALERLKKQQKEYEEAVDYYDRSIKAYPNINHYGKKADRLKEIGKYKEAIECYNQAIKLNSNYSYYNKAHCLMVLGRYEEAIECCDQSIKLHSNYHMIVRYLLNPFGRYEEAIRYCDQAIKLAPEPQHYEEKARSLKELKRYEEAIECCNQAIKLYPNETEDVKKLLDRIEYWRKVDIACNEFEKNRTDK